MSVGESHSSFPRHTSLSDSEAENIMGTIYLAMIELSKARSLADEVAKSVEYHERRVQYLRGVARSRLGLESTDD